MAPLDNTQVVSLVEKPDPDTVTVVPTGAEAGLSVIDRVRALTVKVAEAESPVDPITVTEYVPAATLATTNEAVNVPPETAQVGVPTALPDNEQVVSLEEKPEPDTRTVDPT